jgi:prepilin-type N-terminal cleavage/methylation domain-containing protein
MPRHFPGKAGRAGFSLLEVLLVVAVGLIVTAVGLPRINNVIAMMKLRSSITTVSGLLQNCRMMAVQRNKTLTAKYLEQTTPPYSLTYFVKEGTDSSTTPAYSDTQVELEAPISVPTGAPTGPGAPPALTNTQLGLLASPVYDNPSFNSRGLPCKYVSVSQCDSKAFIKYYKDNRIAGVGGWAAISITPAGRIKRWFWNGSAWID